MRSAQIAVVCSFLTAVAVTGEAGAAAAATPETVRVDRYQVSGNTLLEPAEIDAALAPFLGDRSLEQLKAAARAVEALYVRAGYGGVLVYVPPQKSATPGLIELTVLEGRIARISVLDNRRDSEALVRASLPALRSGSTPRPGELDREVGLANLNPARQVALTLEPGEGKGDIDARLSVTELPERTWSLGLDNTGNTATGRLRGNFGVMQSNLFGLDQSLQLGGQFAPEKIDRVAVVSGAWRAPVYPAGVVIDLVAAYSDVDAGTTSTAAGPLQFSGKGHTVGLRIGKVLPRLGDLTQRLTVGLDYRAYLNNCSIAGLPAGACGSAGASVSVSPVTIDYLLQLPGPVPASLQIGYFTNTALIGRHAGQSAFDLARPGASQYFRGERLNAQALFPLPGDLQLMARVAGQSTRSALVSAEQFGLAGSGAVRGYEQREITGDQALQGSLELRTADLAEGLSPWIDHLQFVTFVDAGRVWNNLDTFCKAGRSDCTLVSAGPGLRAAKQDFQLRLDFASALKSGSLTRRNDQFLHVQASYEFH